MGGPACRVPYSASVFSVSAMSYGSLSKNAVLALNTGEVGLSPYHLGPGGNLIWQIGTGYFSCRDKQGRFNPEEFSWRKS